MDILNNVDPLWIIAISCLCCTVGIVFLVILSFLGGAFDIFLGIFEVGFNFLSAGPLAWCGCLIFLFVCCGCLILTVAAMDIISTCDTDPTNFCKLFGYNG